MFIFASKNMNQDFMRRFTIQSLLVAFLLLFALPLSAQELTVKSFVLLPDDATARDEKYQRTDDNGTLAGLVKVQIALNDVKLDGSMVLDQKKWSASEYWVWMADRATKLTVVAPGYLPLEVNFRNYDFQMLHSKNTYKLVIAVPTGGVQQDDKGILAFKVEPKDAILTLNGLDQTLQNGQYSQLVKKGSYTYELKASGYSPKRGTVQVDEKPELVEVSLQPLQSLVSTMQVSCATAGAQVYLDNQPQGTAPQTLTLSKGAHRLEVRLQGYRTYKEDITIGENERLRRDIPALTQATGRLAVTYLPLESDVYIDGSKVGRTPATFRDIGVGSHQVEIRKDGYTTASLKTSVRDNETTEVAGSLVAEDQLSKSDNEEQPPVGGLDNDTKGPVTVDGIEYAYENPTNEQIKEWAKKYHTLCTHRINSNDTITQGMSMSDTRKRIQVPKSMIADHPCLVYLVLVSKTLDKKGERQSWFDLYSLMDEEKIYKLYSILYRAQYSLGKKA